MRLLIALLLIKAASARDYQQKLYPGVKVTTKDRLVSQLVVKGRVQSMDYCDFAIGKHDTSLLRLFHPSFGRLLWTSPCGPISSFEFTTLGNLLVTCDNEKTALVRLYNQPGVDRLHLASDGNLKIYNNSEHLVWSSQSGDAFNGTKDQIAFSTENPGAKSKTQLVYLIDSTENTNGYIEKESSLKHSDYMQSIITSSFYNHGLFVDVLGSSSTTFNERQFVQSLQRFSSMASKKDSDLQIINFSGAFRQDNSDVADCAIQWIFKQGYYFVAAAGNKGQLRTKANPYQILVGGIEYDSLHNLFKSWESGSNSSAFGPALNLWAPAELFKRPLVGTSVAAATVTRTLISIIQKYSQLQGNPGLGYKVLYQYFSLTDKMPISDSKFLYSINAMKRLDPRDPNRNGENLPIEQLRALIPSDSFCSRLKLSDSRPDWSSLVKLASESVIGDYVATLSPSQYGLFGRFSR